MKRCSWIVLPSTNVGSWCMLRCGHVRAKLLWYLVKSYYNTIMCDYFTSFFLPHMAATKKEDYFMGTQMENRRTKSTTILHFGQPAPLPYPIEFTSQRMRRLFQDKSVKKHERTPPITKRTFIVYEVREPMIRFFQLFYSENGKNIFPT